VVPASASLAVACIRISRLPQPHQHRCAPVFTAAERICSMSSFDGTFSA